MSQKRLPPRMPSILSVPFRSKLLSPVSNKKKFVLKDGYGASATAIVRPRRHYDFAVTVLLFIDLYAGQVTSWKNDRGEELLFSSSKMVSPKSHRGGINFGFPQFRTIGTLDDQMYSRNGVWIVDPNPPPLPSCGNKAFVDLILRPTSEEFRAWPHCFEFRLRVALGSGMLTFTSRIRNTDIRPFSFTFALCTYLLVSDISEVRVEGLETSDYLDNLNMRQRYTEQGDAITFDSEIDRIYLSTPSKIAVIDHEKKQTFVLRKDGGLPDAVIWNPWERKCKTLGDLGDEDYTQMVCIKAAAIEKPVLLKPGEEWRGRQELSTVSSSYFSGQLDPAKVLSI